MSNFIDRLNRVSRGAPQPIGFHRTERASERPKIQLVARLARGDIDSLADYVAGADAGLVPVSRSGYSAEALNRVSAAMSEIPWGGWLEDIDRKKLKQMVSHGCDFIVFPAASTPLTIPTDDELGKILEVEASLDVTLLRALNELPVDAVLVATEEKVKGALTWYQLMLFQRFADLLTKPLLISVPPGVTGNELQTLWEAGVDGIVVEAGVSRPSGELQSLRKTIDGLTFTIPRRREKREALLPRPERPGGTVAEPDEDEEG